MALPIMAQVRPMQAPAEYLLVRRRDITSLCRAQGVPIGLALSNIAFALRAGVISETQAARCLDMVLGSGGHEGPTVWWDTGTT